MEHKYKVSYYGGKLNIYKNVIGGIKEVDLRMLGIGTTWIYYENNINHINTSEITINLLTMLYKKEYGRKN